MCKDQPWESFGRWQSSSPRWTAESSSAAHWLGRQQGSSSGTSVMCSDKPHTAALKLLYPNPTLTWLLAAAPMERFLGPKDIQALQGTVSSVSDSTAAHLLHKNTDTVWKTTVINMIWSIKTLVTCCNLCMEHSVDSGKNRHYNCI